MTKHSDKFVEAMMRQSDSAVCLGCPFYNYSGTYSNGTKGRCYQAADELAQTFKSSVHKLASGVFVSPCMVVKLLYTNYLHTVGEELPEPVDYANDGIIRRINVGED